MMKQLTTNKLLSTHMPGHCGNTNMCNKLNFMAQCCGMSPLEGTTDEDFSNLGDYLPPTGAMEKTTNNMKRIY